jgi:hypothetical protein
MSSVPSVQWIRQYPQFNTTAGDQYPSIISDSSGNTYIAYYASGTGVVSGGTASGSNDIVVFKLDSSGIIQWIKQQSVMNTTLSDTFPSIGIDSLANIYISYQSTGTTSGGTASGSNDIVVFKMDSNGNLIWIVQQPNINTSLADTDPSICVDSSGNIYLTYSTLGTVSGGTYTGTAGNDEIVVFKMNSSGNLIWIRQESTFNTAINDDSPSIILDSSSNIYVTYRTATATTSTSNIVVFKLDSSGTFQWRQSQTVMNTSVADLNPSISVDFAGNIYLAYDTSGTTSGGTNSGSTDIVVFKMNSSGTLLWIRQRTIMNSSSSDSNPTIVSDLYGNLFISYQTTATVSGGTNSASTDIVIFQMDTNGNLLWILQQPLFNTSTNDTFPSINIDINGSLSITYFTASGTVSGGTNSGTNDIIVFKLGGAIPSVPILTANPTTGNAQLTFNWTPGASGGSAITGYVLTDGSLYYYPASNSTSFTATFLNNYTIYTFRLASVNANGISSFATFNSASPVQLSSIPSVQWIRQYPSVSTVGTDQTPSIVSDSSGNTYITYTTTGGAVSGGTASGNNDIVVFKLDSNGVIQWIKQERVMNSSLADQVSIIAIDSSSNIYVTYLTGGTVSGGTAAAGNNVVVFKMDTNGTLLWIRQQVVMSTPGGDEPAGIVTDSSGNVYVSYLTTSGAASGGTNFNTTFDIVVFKMDTNGTLQWIRQQIAFNSNGNDLYPSMSIDSSANLYIAYQAAGTASGGTFSGVSDIVVFKMNTSGTVQWTRQQAVFNTTGTDDRASIYVDSAGNSYVAYQTTGTTSGGTLRTANDIVVFKMNTLGTLQWIRQQPIMNTTGSDQFPKLISDSNGNIFVTYYTTGTVSGGTLTTADDIVVFQMDTNGTLQWILQQPVMNTSLDDQTPSISIDSNDNIYLTYSSTGTASGGTFVGTAGNYNIIVFKLGGATPSAPYPNPTLPTAGDTQLTFNWTSGASGGSPVTSYLLTNGSLTYNPASNATSFNATGLTNRTSYTFQLAASNANGLGAYANFSGATPYKVPLIQWVKQQPDYNQGTAAVASIVTDTQGNLYSTWAVSSGAAVSGGTNTGNTDVVIMKMNSSGTILWLKQYFGLNTSAAEASPNICIDSSNNIYVAYQSSGTTSGGTSLGLPDIAIAKLDSNGTILTIKQFPLFNTTTTDNNPFIAVDNSFNLYLTYITIGTISGGTKSGTAGSQDIAVVSFDSNFNVRWTNQRNVFNTVANEGNSNITLDNAGGVYISYNVSGGFISGGTASGLNDIVIFKLSTSTGTVQWANQYRNLNTSQNEIAPKIACDASGFLYIGYISQGTVSGGTNAGNQDSVVVKIDSAGNILWIKQNRIFNTSSFDQNPAFTVDSLGNCYMSYNTRVAASGGTFIGTAGTTVDVVVYCLDTNGNFQWLIQNPIFNAIQDDTPTSISVDSNGNVYVSTRTTGTISGGTQNTSEDIVFFKLALGDVPSAPSITADPTVGNQLLTYFWTAPSDGGSPITSYRLADLTDTNVFTPASNATSYGVSNLTVGQSYTFKIAASNSIGLGSYSTYNAATFASVPGIVTIYIRPEALQSSLDFWYDGANSNGSAITQYQFTDGTITSNVSSSVAPYRYELKGLTTGTSYSFTIAASNAAGLGPANPFRTVIPGLLPSAPTSPSYSLLATNKYLISWTLPVSDGGATLLGFVLTGYPLDASENIIDNDPSILIKVSVLGATTTEGDITLSNSYPKWKVLVQAVNDPGYSPATCFTSTISL